MFGCPDVIAHSLARQFEQTGISIDAQDRRDVRKQRQDKAVNIHSRIDVYKRLEPATVDATHPNVSYQTIKTRIGKTDF